MVKFDHIKVARISESIVETIEEMILDGSLKPGDRLPPERELAGKFAVSRPSLREALVILESRGLLQSRRGGGTFVCDVVAPTITDPLVHLLRRRPESAFDVLELRHALEEVAAYYAAERATEQDLEAIAQCHERLVATYVDDDADPMEEASADTEFHMSVADASHNIALVHVMRGAVQPAPGRHREESRRSARRRGRASESPGAAPRNFRGDPAGVIPKARERLPTVTSPSLERRCGSGTACSGSGSFGTGVRFGPGAAMPTAVVDLR